VSGGTPRRGQHESGQAEARTSVPLVDVFLTNAVRTSAGPDPGYKRVPPGEAAALVGNRRAVYGDRAPRGFSDGGAQPGDGARMMPGGTTRLSLREPGTACL
jgi:hypothetical protein